jgi:type IV secretion system protein VirD4
MRVPVLARGIRGRCLLRDEPRQPRLCPRRQSLPWKADREAASFMSNAQRHTHFLDSPRIAKVLSRSDFHFSDLRHQITCVFLVLSPNRLDADSRWLRLLGPQALQDFARSAEASVGAQGPSQRLKAPTLFLLDEFAALGRLEAVEDKSAALRQA